MKRPLILITLMSVVAAGAVLMAAWWVLQRPDDGRLPQTNRATVIIDRGYENSQTSISIAVTVARTPMEQVRGLAGVRQLGDYEGMYFPLDSRLPTSFWMKDMVMPIDIVWIKDERIVQINAEVPMPESGATDGELPTYAYAEGGATGVLEMRARRAAELGIEVGMRASLLENVQLHDQK